MVVIYVDNRNMILLLIVVIVVRFSRNCEARSLHNFCMALSLVRKLPFLLAEPDITDEDCEF